jgi:hypothetical protein
MSTRSACVIAGATPDQVTAIGSKPGLEIRDNKLGTLVVGRAGDLVVDYALALPGPVYDIMWNPATTWFAVTIYRGQHATRWDNRPGDDAGYPREADVLGATTPGAILEALDVPAKSIGFVQA